MVTVPDSPEAAATIIASPETGNLRSTVIPPDAPMLVLPSSGGECAGALPTTCPAEELSLLLAFAWMVGGPVCSDVPEPAVSGLAAPPEPFLLPTEPGCGICPKAAPLLPHSVSRLLGVFESTCMLIISMPAPAAEGAADVDSLVAESNPGTRTC